MSDKLQNVVKTLSEREKLSATIWLIIGILQCCAFSPVGIWNIYCATQGFKKAKNVLNPWQGIVASYDSQLTYIIIILIINLFFGWGFGVIGALYDLIAIRGYVLENKQLFEEEGF